MAVTLEEPALYDRFPCHHSTTVVHMVETDYVVYKTERGDYLSLLPFDHVSQYGLPPEAIIGEVLDGAEPGGTLTPDTFVANRAFHEFMHGVVERHAPEMAEFADEARQRQDGWIYVVDRRTPTPAGRVLPEDVIGGFEVRMGHLVAHSYQPIPSHRLMTERGFFQLGDELQQHLVFELAQLRSV
jgi:hypothetical protein